MPEINWENIDECQPKMREQLMKIERRLVAGPATFEDLARELSLNGSDCNQRYIQKLIKKLREEIYNGANSITPARPKYVLKYTDHNLAFPQAAFNINDRKLLNRILKLVAFFDGAIPIKQVLQATNIRHTDVVAALDALSENIEIPVSADIASKLAFLYDKIDKKELVKIYYPPLDQDKSIVVAPYFLKRYNNKWFLIGRIYKENPFTWSVLSLDVMKRMPEDYQGGFTFIPAEPEDLIKLKARIEAYYSKVIGFIVPLSEEEKKNPPHNLKPEDLKPVQVRIRANDVAFKYLSLNKIHSSQTEDQELKEIYLNVVENPMLYQRILAYGDEVEVLEPASLRETIKGIVTNMSIFYKAN